MRSKAFKITLIALVIVIFLLGIISYRAHKVYKSIFRLSFEQITLELQEKNPQCTKLKDCILEPGDILIRRYVTNVTDNVDKIFNPYFLHAAFYIGDGKLFEVVGSGEEPDNQIAITELSKSDWLHQDMKNFIVFRPKNYKNLPEIIENFKNIANDNDYVFGIYSKQNKTASCADILLKTLEKENMISQKENEPRIITPDYLFWSLVQNKENIEVVGFNINPKN